MGLLARRNQPTVTKFRSLKRQTQTHGHSGVIFSCVWHLAPAAPRLPRALPARVCVGVHVCAGSDFKTISILFISNFHPSQPPLVSTVILELNK